MSKGQERPPELSLNVVRAVVVLLFFVGLILIATQIKMPQCIGGGLLDCLDVLLDVVQKKQGPI